MIPTYIPDTRAPRTGKRTNRGSTVDFPTFLGWDPGRDGLLDESGRSKHRSLVGGAKETRSVPNLGTERVRAFDR